MWRHLEVAVLYQIVAGIEGWTLYDAATGQIELQKNRPKPLKTLRRVQNCRRSLPEPCWAPDRAVGKAMRVHGIPSQRFG
jgi:hypothetical protein